MPRARKSDHRDGGETTRPSAFPHSGAPPLDNPILTHPTARQIFVAGDHGCRRHSAGDGSTTADGSIEEESRRRRISSTGRRGIIHDRRRKERKKNKPGLHGEVTAIFIDCSSQSQAAVSPLFPLDFGGVCVTLPFIARLTYAGVGAAPRSPVEQPHPLVVAAWETD
jgi:hypothetical protein